MNIEQLSIDTLLTGTTSSGKAKKEEKSLPSLRRFAGGRAKHIVGLVLVLLAFTFIMMYFKPFSTQDDLVDYKKYPFLKMTSPDDPKLEWDVFVDTKLDQVFLVKNLTSNQKSRRLLAENPTTNIIHVIQHKFNDDQMKFYTVFEGDFDDVHAFILETDPNSQLIPQITSSLFSQKTTSVGDIDEYEVNSLLESTGPSAEIHKDLDGNLIEFRLTGETGLMANNTIKSLDFKVSEPFDINGLKTKLGKGAWMRKWFKLSPADGNLKNQIIKGIEESEKKWPGNRNDLYDNARKNHPHLWGPKEPRTKEPLTKGPSTRLVTVPEGSCKVNTCHKIPQIHNLEVNWEDKCLEYDAWLPISVCETLIDQLQ